MCHSYNGTYGKMTHVLLKDEDMFFYIPMGLFGIFLMGVHQYCLKKLNLLKLKLIIIHGSLECLS